MTVHLCPQWWVDGHVSTCMVDQYLSALIPIALGLGYTFASVIYLFLKNRGHSSHSVRFERARGNPDNEALQGRKLQRYRTIISLPGRILERSAVVVDWLTIVIILKHHTFSSRSNDDVSLTSPFTAVYLSALAALRYGLPRQAVIARLQSQSAIFYGVQWICTLVITHHALVKGLDSVTCSVLLLRLGLFTILVLIHASASRVPIWEEHFVSDGFSPAPEDTVSLLSRLTFFWTDRLLWQALQKGPLETNSLYTLSSHLSTPVVVSAFKIKRAPAPLLRRIFHLLKRDLLRQGAWAALSSIAVFVPPMLIRAILDYLESPDNMLQSTAWLCITGIFVSTLVAGLAECQCGWEGTTITSKLRTILLSEVYAKTLRKRMVIPLQSSHSDEKTSFAGYTADGTILNFVSSDVDSISFMSGAVYLVWVTFPVQIAIGTYLLYKVLGVSGPLGVSLMIAMLPSNVWISKRLASVQEQVLSASDARIQTSNEVLQSIRTIKYYAWEVPFGERVLDKRRVEMKHLRTRFIWWSISMTVFYSLPFIATILTFFLYTVVWGNPLKTSTAFPALAMLAVLRIPLDRMADSITFLIQAHVSLSRISQFLQERESDKYSQSSKTDSPTLGFDGASLIWPGSSQLGTTTAADSSPDHENDGLLTDSLEVLTPRFALKHLSIQFQKGRLNIICGSSGSGKSSVLLGLLGEMKLASGHILFPQEDPNTFSDHEQLDSSDWLSSAKAYCPHEPWILNQSIRSNILLGVPFNAPRYEEVLRAVALGPDITAFANGDQSLAGENGSRLSGGQKQRVALARALYSSAKYVLLDDCLSAVDSRTANHIFFHAIRGPLMRDRTCVLATHHTQLVVPHADYVVVLDGGRVTAQGTAKQVMAGGLLLSSMASEMSARDTTDDELALDEPLEPDATDRTVNERAVKDDDQETKSEGAIPWSTVCSYLAAMGSLRFWGLVLCGFATQQLAALETNLWIKKWAFQYDSLGKEAATSDISKSKKVPAWYFLSIYAGICAIYALITLARDLITLRGSLKASKEIYERVLNSVLFAKLTFFERPLGQITNRLSKDMAVVDQSLASFSVSAFQIVVLVGMIVTLILWVLPSITLLLILAFAFVAFYYVTALYINGARDLKRIEAVARSPLYQQIGETLAGCVSIRSYGKEAVFASQNGDFIDRLNQPSILLGACKQWLIMRINALSSIITFFAGVFVLLNSKSIEAGAAGLVLTYTSTFTENMLWLVQVYAIIQENLTSVERIVEYTSIPQEVSGPVISTRRSAQQIPQNWPQRGGVRFQAFSARYAPHLDPVLKDITFEAHPGERVAVVGRTGAGKSSLVLALLRSLEADSGSIDIDGIDIATVPLTKLRGEAVTVVPQDAQLFKGTVRTSLDPLQRHRDEAMMEVLMSMGQDLELDAPASELSRGQRQILCVARGLLRRSQVLVLDEATASVDHVADVVIQRGLRAYAETVGATVITIAHRLTTITNYDRVVVLDAGRVVEQGRVKELFGRQGVFRRFCEESGVQVDR